MAKLISMPLRLVAGILAGVAGKSLFRAVWGLIDDEEAPKAEQRRIRVPMLALALVIEGALFRALKGLADHGRAARSRGSPDRGPARSSPRPSDARAARRRIEIFARHRRARPHQAAKPLN